MCILQVLGNGMTITVPDDGSAADANQNLASTVDDVVAIIPKCLSKALTPPVTIKNFFKPKVKNLDEPLHDSDIRDSPVPCTSGKSNGTESGSDGSSDIECIIDEEDFVDSKHEQSARLKSKTKTKNDSSKEAKTKTKKDRSKESKTKTKKDSSKESNSSSRTKTTCVQASANSSTAEKSSKKRSASGTNCNSTPAKKAKQVNIMASFAKQKSIKEEQGSRCQSCPVCGQTFPPNTSNKDLNEHVDNCLIE